MSNTFFSLSFNSLFMALIFNHYMHCDTNERMYAKKYYLERLLARTKTDLVSQSRKIYIFIRIQILKYASKNAENLFFVKTYT